MVAPAEEIADGGVVGVVCGPVQGRHLALPRAIHVRVALSIQQREKGQGTIEVQQRRREGGGSVRGNVRVEWSQTLPAPSPSPLFTSSISSFIRGPYLRRVASTTGVSPRPALSPAGPR